MLIQLLVLSELSKEPSKLHNTAPITFHLITFGWSGLQTDYAGIVFKTLWKRRRPQHEQALLFHHKKIQCQVWEAGD